MQPFTIPAEPFRKLACCGDGYVDCGNDTTLDLTDAIAIESWFWLSDNTGKQIILSKWLWGYSYEMVVTHGGQIRMDVYPNMYTHTTPIITTKKWFHVFGKYNRENIQIFINGVLRAVSEPYSEKAHSTNLNVEIGGRSYPNYENPIKGYMATIRLYGQDFTIDEIHDLALGRKQPTDFDCRLWHDYRLGHANDLSGNNNHGIVHNFMFV